MKDVLLNLRWTRGLEEGLLPSRAEVLRRPRVGSQWFSTRAMSGVFGQHNWWGGRG